MGKQRTDGTGKKENNRSADLQLILFTSCNEHRNIRRNKNHDALTNQTVLIGGEKSNFSFKEWHTSITNTWGATHAPDKVRLLKFPGLLVSRAKQPSRKWKIRLVSAASHMQSQVSARSYSQWGIRLPKALTATSPPNVGCSATKRNAAHNTHCACHKLIGAAFSQGDLLSLHSSQLARCREHDVNSKFLVYLL